MSYLYISWHIRVAFPVVYIWFAIPTTDTHTLIWCALWRRWASCCLWSTNMSIILERRTAKWQCHSSRRGKWTPWRCRYTLLYLLSSCFSTNHRHVHENKLSLSLQKFYRYSYEVEFMQNVIKDKITTEAKAFKSMLIFRP